MIDKSKITAVLDKAIEGTDVFVVELTVSKDNDIVVELDSPTGVDLDFCAKVSDAINSEFDRDAEDYSLEVGTASLTAPFKVEGQWEKNLGNTIEILTRDGRKLQGTLTATSPEEFTVEISRKVKEPGEKRPRMVEEPVTMAKADIREARYHIEFK